jgi:beta-glucosidase
LADRSSPNQLDETCGYLDQRPSAIWFDLGRLSNGIRASAGGIDLPSLRGEGGGIVSRGIDKDRQADAREITFDAGSTIAIEQDGKGEGDFVILYNLANAPIDAVTLTVGETNFDITRQLQLSAGKGWREMILTDECLPEMGNAIALATESSMVMQIARITRQKLPEGTECSF